MMDNQTALEAARALGERAKTGCTNPDCRPVIKGGLATHYCDPEKPCCEGCRIAGDAGQSLLEIKAALFDPALAALEGSAFWRLHDGSFCWCARADMKPEDDDHLTGCKAARDVLAAIRNAAQEALAALETLLNELRGSIGTPLQKGEWDAIQHFGEQCSQPAAQQRIAALEGVLGRIANKQAYPSPFYKWVKDEARAALAPEGEAEPPRWHEGMRGYQPALCWRYVSGEGEPVCILERGHDGGKHEPT